MACARPGADHLCHAARRDPEHPAAVGPDLVSPVISRGLAGHAGHGRRRGVRVPARRPGARRPGAATAGACDVGDGRSPFLSFTSCTLVIPIPPLTEARLSLILPLAVSIVLLGVPFFLSGVAVTVALTRLGAPIGRLYAWDLAGAAAGCLLRDPAAGPHQPHVGDVRRRRRRRRWRPGVSPAWPAGGATAPLSWRRCSLASRDGTRKYNAFPVLYPEEPGTLADGRQRGDDGLDDPRVRGAGPAG